MATRQDFFISRAAAWLKYLREGRTDLVPPNQAAEAVRVNVVNAGQSLSDFGTSETELWMHMFNYHQASALRCLNRLRLGVGKTAMDIEDMRGHLAKAKLAPDDKGLDLSDIGTDEDELRFFLTSDPLKAE